jgi:hypothetical protein
MANRNRTIHGIPILLVVLALAGVMSPVHAATSITVNFIPAPPVPNQPLIARLADTQGGHCWPAATSIVQSGTTITVSLSFSDSCNASRVLPYRDYALGSLPQGSYVFVYKSCASNPPPLPSSCNTVLQVPLIVAPPPVPTPTLSTWGLFGLSLGLAAMVARTFRRRHAFTRRQ